MPYENEHTAVLQDSKKYDPDSFRRTHGGKIYGKITVPKTIDILWAKLKGKSKPTDYPHPVSLRFPTKNWTVQTAKAWLKKNKVSYRKFEPAKKKEKSSMSENTAPIKACIFHDNAEVTFAQGDDDKKGNHFRIVGYSGGVMKNHWFWGNVAFDLRGMKFAKSRTPVLAEHFRDVRIGFTTKQEIKDQVVVEGPFLDNPNAQNLRADMQKGFPMEASLLVPALVVEHVREGASVKVNGHTLQGPGTVFRQCSIKEVSMCVFGLDSKTKSLAGADGDNQKIKFNLIQETSIMSEETQTVTEIESVESFAALYPEFHAEIKATGVEEGKKEERALFAALQDACGDDHELMVQCFTENKSPIEAMKLHGEKLGKKNAELAAEVTDLQKKKPAVEAAVTEFTDAATPPGEQTETGSADEDTWKKEFAADADLRVEFGGDEKAYIAFKQAEAKGQVRTLHSNN
jgi:hypothetical protein